MAEASDAGVAAGAGAGNDVPTAPLIETPVLNLVATVVGLSFGVEGGVPLPGDVPSSCWTHVAAAASRGQINVLGRVEVSAVTPVADLAAGLLRACGPPVRHKIAKQIIAALWCVNFRIFSLVHPLRLCVGHAAAVGSLSKRLWHWAWACFCIRSTGNPEMTVHFCNAIEAHMNSPVRVRRAAFFSPGAALVSRLAVARLGLWLFR